MINRDLDHLQTGVQPGTNVYTVYVCFFIFVTDRCSRPQVSAAVSLRRTANDKLRYFWKYYLVCPLKRAFPPPRFQLPYHSLIGLARGGHEITSLSVDLKPPIWKALTQETHMCKYSCMRINMLMTQCGMNQLVRMSTDGEHVLIGTVVSVTNGFLLGRKETIPLGWLTGTRLQCQPCVLQGPPYPKMADVKHNKDHRTLHNETVALHLCLYFYYNIIVLKWNKVVCIIN